MKKVTPYRCDRAVAAIQKIRFAKDFDETFTESERRAIYVAEIIIRERGRQILEEALEEAGAIST